MALAAFPMAAAILTKSHVTLKGYLKNDLLQADGHILPLLKKMGAKFEKTSKTIRIKGPCIFTGREFFFKGLSRSCSHHGSFGSLC